MSESSLNSIRVPVEVVLGSVELTVEELSRISEGTLIELDRLAGEPVELKAAGKTIAKGEVVVIDENFGMRVSSIADE
jgi:flagellar motor switch protein FliN/FliY